MKTFCYMLFAILVISIPPETTSLQDEHVIQSQSLDKNENVKRDFKQGIVGIEGTAVNAKDTKSIANDKVWHGEIIHAETASGNNHKQNSNKLLTETGRETNSIENTKGVKITEPSGSSQGTNVATQVPLKKTGNVMEEKTSESQLTQTAEAGLNSTRNQATNNTEIKSNSTCLLCVFEKIKRELDEVMAIWKNQHRYFFRKFFKAFVEDRFKTKKLHVPRILGIRARRKRSGIQNENGFSKEILRRIEDNFPCRDQRTLALIKSGKTFFNQADCLQCTCHMAKLTCKENQKKCYPNACHLQDREIVQNFATHQDGCNNCLCYFGELICTRLRCPEAGHRYTNYEAMGLGNVEPENNLDRHGSELPTRKLDSCLECDHLTGSSVCGLRQWKTFPTYCHAIFCGRNNDETIDNRGSCETLDPCTSSTCGELEHCVPLNQSACIGNELCRQFKCISKEMWCSNENTGIVCGEDRQSYESECELKQKGVKLAYRGKCTKNCQSEVCGIESRTFANRCHANGMNAHVDYNGRCEYHFNSALMKDNEKGSSYENHKCEMVYENGRCSPVKCEATVLPPGACCPICGAALVISINHKTPTIQNGTYRLHDVYTFLTENQINAHHCKVSVDLTYTMDILVVIQPYNRHHLETCRDFALHISDQMNFERSDRDAGIFTLLGAATLVKEKVNERMIYMI